MYGMLTLPMEFYFVSRNTKRRIYRTVITNTAFETWVLKNSKEERLD